MRTTIAAFLLAALTAPACTTPPKAAPDAGTASAPGPQAGGDRGAGLSGTRWDVVAYSDGGQGVVSVLAGTRISASFGADGQVTGNAGCNRYFASYLQQGPNLMVGMAATTRMFCAEPSGLMRQESLYLDALRSSATLSLAGDRLELRTGDRALAVILERRSGE